MNIYEACRINNTEVVKDLLEDGASVKESTSNDCSLVMHACEGNNVIIAEVRRIEI